MTADLRLQVIRRAAAELVAFEANWQEGLSERDFERCAWASPNPAAPIAATAKTRMSNSRRRIRVIVRCHSSRVDSYPRPAPWSEPAPELPALSRACRTIPPGAAPTAIASPLITASATMLKLGW
jgi:hypothetical protein